MTVNAVEDPSLNRSSKSFILACGYCSWSSKDIGIQFDEVKNMSAQLSKIYNRNLRESSGRSPFTPEPATDLSRPDSPDVVFANLKTFLKAQMNDAQPENPLLTPSGSYNYSSPGSIAKIMALYGGPSHGKKATAKPTPIRESLSLDEGLRLTAPTAEIDAIARLRNEGYPGTTVIAQRSEQLHDPCNFPSELRPIPMLLRTKTAKRCRTCRHILVKPEPKVESTRYRIRLLALNYVPTIHIKPLQASPSPEHLVNLDRLQPLQTSQFLLSFRNPLFDPVSVTLATPTRTPGQWGHSVTILCPQFDIGANADKWDEALSHANPAAQQQLPHQKAAGRSTRPFGDPRPEYVGQEGRLAEAGKMWEKGRNWTSVVVEVGVVDIGGEVEAEEDEDVLEVPVFVRVEWEAEVEEKGKEGGREKRELAYWVVLGLGRVESRA
ncbi:MAG: hypothetical protein Q9220_001970 [cf. Caloplaca sp. 1 TL-2023]